VESAALAGVGSALLLSLSVYLLGRQPGVGSTSDDPTWYADSGNQFAVLLGLNFASLGVIAFLWFMAVIRRRLGDREDQFFATVFLSRGVAFRLLTSPRRSTRPRRHSSSTSATRQARIGLPSPLRMDCGSALWAVSASRLAGVFMAATSTIGMRFDALPQ
jgi:hypothetical protein